MGQDHLAGSGNRPRDAPQFHREQALVVSALKRACQLAGGLIVALALATPAHATPRGIPGIAATVPITVAPQLDTPTAPRLRSAEAIRIFLTDPKVVAWLKRYPPNPDSYATFGDGDWTVNVSSGAAGEIATGTVDDQAAIVTEAWTGPQVAWPMARGGQGAFGGNQINSYPIWLGFCALFLIGLIDWRRLRSLRNLDLIVLLSFSVSLWYFKAGDIFTSVPLAYPPLLYLLARAVWIGRRDRSPYGQPVWPVWLLAGAAVFVGGFRIGLNIESSNAIDVGYAGVIGADRIAHGEDVYGNFPITTFKFCPGQNSASGSANRIQSNGRCETPLPQGDTYGPVSYEAYLPGYLAFGWTGLWDTLPAVHATTILWDLICILGLAFVGRRFGGNRLAATLAFAWVSWPFTQYVNNSNTNDMIMPAFLIWGFAFATSQTARGAFTALASWAKFAALILVPLWAAYPEARRLRPTLKFTAAFVVATIAAFSFMLTDPSPLHALRVFYDRTFPVQVGRHSPFSLWDWGQYHAKGIPNLKWVQHVLEGILVAGALILGWWPRRRSALQLAAFSAALLIGFEIVLTHWFYLYLPWFFPFVAFMLFLPRQAEPEPPEELDELSPPAVEPVPVS
jgi:hypothetical protein